MKSKHNFIQLQKKEKKTMEKLKQSSHKNG